MSIAGDLTSSNYWEEVWAAAPANDGYMARLRRISQWKYDRMIRRLLDSASSSKAEVLELGCAPGAMLQRIHRLRPDLKLSGIDYAEEGCRTTAAVLKGMELPANVFHGDVRSVELSSQFDMVMSFGLIEHFDDPVEILRCHARFCRPGATVAVTLPNFTSPVVRYFADRFCPDNIAIHNLKIMNLRVLETSMINAGLQQVRVGGDGGNQLHTLISRQDLPSKAYAIAGRMWNAGSIAIPPQLGWHSYLWGIGKVAS
jgi:2-polyprenyl-3-methyl-5-hydroxy-6-metoxy-1,4-benzoquinol methylase